MCCAIATLLLLGGIALGWLASPHPYVWLSKKGGTRTSWIAARVDPEADRAGFLARIARLDRALGPSLDETIELLFGLQALAEHRKLAPCDPDFRRLALACAPEEHRRRAIFRWAALLRLHSRMGLGLAPPLRVVSRGDREDLDAFLAEVPAVDDPFLRELLRSSYLSRELELDLGSLRRRGDDALLTALRKWLTED